MAFIPVYILILFFTIGIDYVAGILIEDAQGKRRKMFLVISVLVNVGMLAVFKYYNFIAENINYLLHTTDASKQIPMLGILLPLGLSFHTFQAMSYTIEVYRGDQKAERHLGIYALYVMFYPQLVAGPIERPQNLLHQFHEKHTFKYDDVVTGLRQILWGLFKKVVIADMLATIVDPVYNNPQAHSGTMLFIATVFFAFEVYCDFSGYSDIALGTARVMGYRLMINFDKPFSAKSISEFWRRWHISLFTWLRDYIFNPIAIGLRDWGMYALVIAAMVTFFTSGLWHGAAWTYIVFGSMHGVAVSYEVLTAKFRKKMFKKIPKRLGEIIGQVCTFSFVLLSFIFFRSHGIHNAFYIIGKIPSAISELGHAGVSLFGGIKATSILYCFGLIVLLEIIQKIEGKDKLYEMISARPKAVRWAIYYLIIGSIIFFGVFEQKSFVYFQF